MVDVEGSDATRYRCPPGTLGAGDWTNVMGSTCNLGPGRDTVSDITQATSGAKPKAPKRRGLRDRAVAGVLDRFAQRARPQEDMERRRSILTPSPAPEGSTSGRLPDRRRIEIDKPETPKPPTGPNRAVAAATDDAKKKNIKNNGKGIAGNQFGQNFGKEDAAKKQAVVSAESFNRRVFIVKNDNGAARPYRVVDEDRARSIKNGSIVGVVTPDGKHRSIDAADFSPSDAIDELDKSPDFGKPMGPNGPSGPKTPKPKTPSNSPEDRSTGFPSIEKDLTEEERNGLESERRQWDEIRERQREITDSFADSGSVEDIQKIINKTEEAIERTKSSQANFLKKWREGDNTSAADYHGYGVILEQREAQLSHAKSALERAELVKKNLSEAREEADRLQGEQEEVARRAAEQAGINPPEPQEPRTVGVGEIFEKPKPVSPTAREPENVPVVGVSDEARKEVTDKLPKGAVPVNFNWMDVDHGNDVVNGFFVPKEVPVGNKGIDSQADAVDYLLDGGSLDDIPDEFLHHAILESADYYAFGTSLTPDQRAKQKRFLIVDDEVGGINDSEAQDESEKTLIVKDVQTGRQYVVKSPIYFQGEFANELYSGFMQQLLGLHTPRYRMVRGKDYGNMNYPLVIEHLDNLIDPSGGSILPGDELDPDAFVLNQTSFESFSKDMTLLLDNTMRNDDRHEGNYLGVQKPNGDIDILPIDNGAAGQRDSSVLMIDDQVRILKHMVSQTTFKKEMKEHFASVDIQKAFEALEALEDRITSDPIMGNEYTFVTFISDPHVARIRNFLSAIEVLQTQGVLSA